MPEPPFPYHHICHRIRSASWPANFSLTTHVHNVADNNINIPLRNVSHRYTSAENAQIKKVARATARAIKKSRV